MPRNPVVNRNNLHKMPQYSLTATPDSIAQLRLLADALHVSQGSILDTALRELFLLQPHQIARLLAKHKHLTTEEHAVVLAVIASTTKESVHGIAEETDMESS